jgi:hypothetical protein
MADSEKQPLLQQTELALKIGTGIIAVLYVLGLMISNAQLMELGITDFASLQTRNVMVGLLYVIYLFALAILLAPVALVIPLCVLTPRASDRSFWRNLGIIFGLLSVEFSLLLLIGTIVGYLFPWGRAWQSSFALSFHAFYQDFVIPFIQLYDTYFRLKVLVVSFNLLLLETAVFLFFIRKKSHHTEISEMIAFVRTNPVAYPAAIAITLFFLTAFPILALFDYADEVYPNFRSNLGGGQPQISNLTLAGKKSEMAGLDATGLSPRLLCCQGADDQASMIEDAAIWYQSDKFLYIATAANLKSRVVAIDLNLVRSIHYLPKYVKVSSGARIESIGFNPF